MEAPVEAYVNGTVEEQAAPQTLQELQAAVQQVHAMPVVVGAFQDALAADPNVRLCWAVGHAWNKTESDRLSSM
jgi:hypothetical protein